MATRTTTATATKEEAETYRDTPKWDMVLAMVAEMFTIHEEVKHKAESHP